MAPFTALAFLALSVSASPPLSVSAPLAGGGAITVSVGSASSLRLSVRFGWGPAPLDSPSLDATRALAPAVPVTEGGYTGLAIASVCSLLVATDGSGEWVFRGARNETLVASAGSPSQVPSADGEGGVLLPVTGVGATDGPTRAASCLNNGDFSTPFYHNEKGLYLAYPVSAWLFDPAQPHCYPASFAGVPGPLIPPPVCNASTPGKEAVGGERTASYPDGLPGASLSYCCRLCDQDEECAGFSYQAAVGAEGMTACYPLKSWESLRDAVGTDWFGPTLPPAPSAQQGWWVLGAAADMYLAPAPAPLDYVRALFELTGAPGIPPLYGMGFMATYWGYSTMEEVEGNMTAFRDGAYPIDSHIMDYDWWDPRGRYNDSANFDFGYDAIMFGPHSFVHAPTSTIPNATTKDAPSLLAHFRNDLNLRFAGIRKPRTYSNSAFSNASGWLLPSSFEVGAGGNNWNMTPGNGWSEWWIPKTAHFLRDGMAFWWNDEGETQFFTYLWWNEAERAVSELATPSARFFSINRAFQPGMQRHPAVTWSGDDQDCSKVKFLGFARAGQPYFCCDMTSPSATVLVRQYQNAIFLPIMRVHAMHGTPRFPFLWGTAEHAAAFRAALNLRYTFLPHLYSLAHAGYKRLAPIAMPASWVFPHDPTFPSELGDVTYMVGDSLLPADVSVARAVPDAAENTTNVHLPPGVWYMFGTTTALPGLQHITFTDVPLDHVVLFVRAGAILTLHSNDAAVGPPQHVSQLGGDLAVHVYAGRDGAFELVEDDGETLSYTAAHTRVTSFVWDDAARTLSWSVVDGGGVRAAPYTRALPTLFVANASTPLPHAAVALGDGGGRVTWA